MTPSFDELPKGYFRALVADPAWRFKSRTALQAANWKSRRDVEKHYSVMTLDEICALPVGSIAARDAHLFLWVTGPCLPMGFDVLKAWVSNSRPLLSLGSSSKNRSNEEADHQSIDQSQLRIVPTAECDLHVGLGLTTRKNAEFVLLGRRGNAKRLAKDVREVILSPVREHSRKPDEAYDRVRRYCSGPYIDLFAREQRDGWTAWGNEVTKFDGVAA